MPMTLVSGIVIRERQSGDNDKFLDILTDKLGLIEVIARGVKKITCKYASSSQLFAYSKFCLNKRNERYYIDSAEPVKIFYPIREDLARLSLASYFSEVISYAVLPDESRNEEVLRLFLNVLHYLSEGTRDTQLLKSIFELRFMSDIGHMPGVVGCADCGTYLTDQMYFRIENGSLYCSDCFSEHGRMNAVCINVSVINAIRHIVLVDMKKLFSFRLSEESMNALGYISETYLISHLGRNFRTLDFYKTII